jgi:hypothetical protein
MLLSRVQSFTAALRKGDMFGIIARFTKTIPNLKNHHYIKSHLAFLSALS